MINSFKSFVTEQELFANTDRVLLAVSGGLDSMVMLDLFARSGFKFEVAHCNFKLRGKASDGDETLVEMKCKDLDVPFHCRRFDTKAYATDKPCPNRRLGGVLVVR